MLYIVITISDKVKVEIPKILMKHRDTENEKGKSKISQMMSCSELEKKCIDIFGDELYLNGKYRKSVVRKVLDRGIPNVLKRFEKGADNKQGYSYYANSLEGLKMCISDAILSIEKKGLLTISVLDELDRDRYFEIVDCLKKLNTLLRD